MCFDRLRSGARCLFEYATPRSSPVATAVDAINAYLVDGPNVLVKDRRRALSPIMDSDIRFGSMAADNGGLLLTAEQYMVLLMR